MPSQLEARTFADVVRLAPLASIDLIVGRQDNRVLLCRRTMPPARGWWLIPGGRIRKDERQADATARLLTEELGWAEATTTRLRGVYEHDSTDIFQGTRQFGMHYLVLAYDAWLEAGDLALPLAQHSEYCWLSVPDLLTSPDVHPYTQDYFRGDTSG